MSTSTMKAAIVPFDAEREYFFAEGCYINELSNCDNDADVSVAQARVEPGKTTRWHYLRDIAERYVMLSGNGRVEVEGLPAKNVAAGDVVLIPAGARQRISNVGEGDLIFLAVCTPRFVEAAYVDAEGQQE